MRTAMVILAMVGMAAAETMPLPNPEILRQQSEAQERERSMARRIDWQVERAKGLTAAQAVGGQGAGGAVSEQRKERKVARRKAGKR